MAKIFLEVGIQNINEKGLHKIAAAYFCLNKRQIQNI